MAMQALDMYCTGFQEKVGNLEENLTALVEKYAKPKAEDLLVVDLEMEEDGGMPKVQRVTNAFLQFASDMDSDWEKIRDYITELSHLPKLILKDPNIPYGNRMRLCAADLERDVMAWIKKYSRPEPSSSDGIDVFDPNEENAHLIVKELLPELTELVGVTIKRVLALTSSTSAAEGSIGAESNIPSSSLLCAKIEGKGKVKEELERDHEDQAVDIQGAVVGDPGSETVPAGRTNFPNQPPNSGSGKKRGHMSSQGSKMKHSAEKREKKMKLDGRRASPPPVGLTSTERSQEGAVALRSVSPETTGDAVSTAGRENWRSTVSTSNGKKGGAPKASNKNSAIVGDHSGDGSGSQHEEGDGSDFEDFEIQARLRQPKSPSADDDVHDGTPSYPDRKDGDEGISGRDGAAGDNSVALGDETPVVVLVNPEILLNDQEDNRPSGSTSGSHHEMIISPRRSRRAVTAIKKSVEDTNSSGGIEDGQGQGDSQTMGRKRKRPSEEEAVTDTATPRPPLLRNREGKAKKPVAPPSMVEGKQETGSSSEPTCGVCKVTFCRPYSLERHTKEVHEDTKKDHKCSQCSSFFSSKSQLGLHTNRVHKPKPDLARTTCPVCGKEFAVSYIAKHTRKDHPKP